MNISFFKKKSFALSCLGVCIILITAVVLGTLSPSKDSSKDSRQQFTKHKALFAALKVDSKSIEYALIVEVKTAKKQKRLNFKKITIEIGGKKQTFSVFAIMKYLKEKGFNISGEKINLNSEIIKELDALDKHKITIWRLFDIFGWEKQFLTSDLFDVFSLISQHSLKKLRLENQDYNVEALRWKNSETAEKKVPMYSSYGWFRKGLKKTAKNQLDKLVDFLTQKRKTDDWLLKIVRETIDAKSRLKDQQKPVNSKN